MKNNSQISTFAQILPSSANAFKGLLIIIVVMDHNDLLRMFAPDVFRPLTFHVLGFLVLPFLLTTTKSIDRQFFRDRLIRYLVPFWWVLTLATVIYTILYRNGDELNTVVIDWMAAATIGSAQLVKISSGFYYLWFLPCLAGLVITLALYQSLKDRWRCVCSVVMLFTHATISLFPDEIIRYVPFGLLIVVWVFPLGLLMRWAVNSAAVYSLRYVVLAAFLGSYSYLVLIRLNIEIMTLDFSSITEPLRLLLQDVNAVSGVLVSTWIAKQLCKLKALAVCGKHSLMLYLLHPFLFLLGYKLLGVPNWNLEHYPLLAAGVISVVLTVLIALGLAMAIARIPLARAWLTPKDWKDWGPVRLLSRA